uniref:Uncharacterized protein n=1 Tax=Shigella sonnei TaxID=624 RepID=A0A896ZDA1_SHISO|nr:hypothetical protein NOOHOHFM_00190 [Shigella sonnei]
MKSMMFMSESNNPLPQSELNEYIMRSKYMY